MIKLPLFLMNCRGCEYRYRLRRDEECKGCYCNHLAEFRGKESKFKTHHELKEILRLANIGENLEEKGDQQ